VGGGGVRRRGGGGAGGYELSGESIGFLKLGADGARLLRTLLDARVAAGATGIEHEEVYPELLARLPVGFERVDGAAWTEIDFPAALQPAEREHRPPLDERAHAPCRPPRRRPG